MPNTFFASDHHMGHAGIVQFLRRDGVTKLRDFDDAQQMDEHIIAQHNKVVRPQDTIWFLGDVVINRRFLSQIARMNGRKRLVLGNHDIFKNKDYYNAGFEDLHAFVRFPPVGDNPGFVCTHIPVHSDSLGRWGANVHGHLHADRVRLPRGVDAKTGAILYSDKIDPRYYCVCMEQLDDYTPISLEDLRYALTNSK